MPKQNKPEPKGWYGREYEDDEVLREQERMAVEELERFKAAPQPYQDG